MFTSRRILFSISIKKSPERQTLQQQIEHFEHALENVMSSKDPNYTTHKLYPRKYFFFPLKIVNSKNLGSYMSFLSNYRFHITSQCLIIGGQSFYSVQNMNEDFVNYLGRRKYLELISYITDQVRMTIYPD